MVPSRSHLFASIENYFILIRPLGMRGWNRASRKKPSRLGERELLKLDRKSSPAWCERTFRPDITLAHQVAINKTIIKGYDRDVLCAITVNSGSLWVPFSLVLIMIDPTNELRNIEFFSFLIKVGIFHNKFFILIHLDSS